MKKYFNVGHGWFSGNFFILCLGKISVYRIRDSLIYMNKLNKQFLSFCIILSFFVIVFPVMAADFPDPLNGVSLQILFFLQQYGKQYFFSLFFLLDLKTNRLPRLLLRPPLLFPEK